MTEKSNTLLLRHEAALADLTRGYTVLELTQGYTIAVEQPQSTLIQRARDSRVELRQRILHLEKMIRHLMAGDVELVKDIEDLV